MKVIRIISELDFGGVEQVLALSVPCLIQNEGVKVKVIVLGKGGRISESLIQNGFDVLILNEKTKIPNLRLVRQLRRIVETEMPDVVHCQGAEANFHGLWAADLAGVKTKIGEEIGIPNHHSYWKWIFRWVYQKADYVIAISEAVKKHIVELGEVKEEKVRVVYNPVGSGQLADDNQHLVAIEQVAEGSPTSYMEEKRETFVFVTTCRLVPIKNLGRLIQVFGDLQLANPGKELRLDIIGDGPEREKLEATVMIMDFKEKIRFLGFQSDVYPFLRNSDVFVLPSFTEGSSVSLAEAMVVGLPSIVTQNGGASEILGQSQSGILIDPLQSKSILSAMQHLLGLRKEERQAMSESAQKEAKRFSTEHYIDSLMSIYTFSDFRLKPSAF